MRVLCWASAHLSALLCFLPVLACQVHPVACAATPQDSSLRETDCCLGLSTVPTETITLINDYCSRDEAPTCLSIVIFRVSLVPSCIPHQLSSAGLCLQLPLMNELGPSLKWNGDRHVHVLRVKSDYWVSERNESYGVQRLLGERKL